jgi:SulP family sulfate permease
VPFVLAFDVRWADVGSGFMKPFFHIIANRIAADIGPERPREVVATTLVAFALSSVLTGASSYHVQVRSEWLTWSWGVNRAELLLAGRAEARVADRLFPAAHPGGVHRRRRALPHDHRVSALPAPHPTCCVRVLMLTRGSFTVSTRMDDDEFRFSLETARFFFEGHNLALWVPALALAVLLRVITHRWHHQLIFPVCE